MADSQLRLNLSAGESLPTGLCWLIEKGYLTLWSANQGDGPTPLGIWGPGELVMPSLLGLEAVQLLSLTAVTVREWSASPDDEHRCLEQIVHQLATLLQLAQIRRADQRLHALLRWLGERFGDMHAEGVTLSFNAINLTHRNLADLAGLTRVTVTKTLIRFRQEGILSRHGQDDVLLLRAERTPPGGQPGSPPAD